jgi:predicted dehydrogenase
VAEHVNVRFGVIGAGWFASRRHIPDIVNHSEATLAALCRRNPAELDTLKRHFEPERVYADWRAMLNDCPLDAVVIATPHNLHFEAAKAALERGLHVLLEKPMTIEPSEARTLCETARSNRLYLSVALNPPFWAHCHRIRGAISDGRIGEIEGISLFWSGDARPLFGRAEVPTDLPGVVRPSFFRSDPDINGGGYLIDGGSHLISEILWTTSMKALNVSCHMDSTPSDIRSCVSLTLENGAVATIVTIGDSDHQGRRVRNTFAGSRGTITVEGFEFQTTIRVGDETTSFAEKELPPVPGPVDNLIDTIRGRAAIASTAQHGAEVVEVVSSCYSSAENGETIHLNGTE